MIILVTIIFFIFPILSIPFCIIGIFFDKNNRFKYCILLTVCLSIISYYMVPDTTDDLYRNQLQTQVYKDYDIHTILFDNTEQIRILIQLLFGKIGNVDLLQAIGVFIHYILIFYILCDCQKKYELKMSYFVIIFLFTILSFILVNIAGNLWNPIAISVFAFVVYLEYCKGKNKILCNILEILTILIHSSMIFPIIIKIIFEVSKCKINKIAVISVVLVLFFIEVIFNFLTRFSNIPIISEILSFYNTYFLNSEGWGYLHTTTLLLTYFTIIIPFLLIYILLYKKRDYISDFTFLTTISTIVLFFNTTFAIRFIPLIQLLGIPIIFDFLKNSKKKTNRYIILFYMFGIIFGYIYYQYIKTMDYSFGTFEEKMFSNIYSIFIK